MAYLGTGLALHGSACPDGSAPGHVRTNESGRHGGNSTIHGPAKVVEAFGHVHRLSWATTNATGNAGAAIVLCARPSHAAPAGRPSAEAPLRASWAPEQTVWITQHTSSCRNSCRAYTFEGSLTSAPRPLGLPPIRGPCTAQPSSGAQGEGAWGVRGPSCPGVASPPQLLRVEQARKQAEPRLQPAGRAPPRRLVHECTCTRLPERGSTAGAAQKWRRIPRPTVLATLCWPSTPARQRTGRPSGQ